MPNKTKVDPEFNCEYTDEIVCPYCGIEQSDSWEVDRGDECATTNCQSCGKEMNVTIHKSVSYSSQCMDGEHDFVTDDWHIPDAMACKRCGEMKFKRFDRN